MLVVISHILTTPYILSLVDYYYIYHASPPLRPIKGVRGIYLFYYPNTKKQKWDICICISKYLLYLSPSYQALSKGTTLSRGDKENYIGLFSYQFQQYYSSMASDCILCRQSPQGLEGAVYLFVYLFVYIYLSINIRLSMLSIRGQGILSNTIYLYWIIQVP